MYTFIPKTSECLRVTQVLEVEGVGFDQVRERSGQGEVKSGRGQVRERLGILLKDADQFAAGL